MWENIFCHISASLYLRKSRNMKAFSFPVATWIWLNDDVCSVNGHHNRGLSSRKLLTCTKPLSSPLRQNRNPSIVNCAPLLRSKLVPRSYQSSLVLLRKRQLRVIATDKTINPKKNKPCTSVPLAFLFSGDGSLMDALLLGIHLITAVDDVTGLASPRKSFHRRNLRGFQATERFY